MSHDRFTYSAPGKQYRKREYPPVYPERKLFTARTNDPRREVPALSDLTASVQYSIERSLRKRLAPDSVA